MTPGPVPNIPGNYSSKSNEARAWRNAASPSSAPCFDLEWPETPERWADDDVVLALWDAIKNSQTASWYAQSDVAVAYYTVDELWQSRRGTPLKDRHGNPVKDADGNVVYTRKPSPEMTKAITQLFGVLLLTEGERRRARLTLTPERAEEDAAAAAVLRYRQRLGLVPAEGVPA